MHPPKWYESETVCGETPNLNETESKTFSDTKFFRYRIRYFFRYQFFSNNDPFFRYKFCLKPIPILFPIPKFSETNTDTLIVTYFFRNRYRYHLKTWKFLNHIWSFLDKNLWTGLCHWLNAETHSFPAMFNTWGSK